MMGSIRFRFLFVFSMVAILLAILMAIAFSRVSALRHEFLEKDANRAAHAAASAVYSVVSASIHDIHDWSRALPASAADRKALMADIVTRHRDLESLFFVGSDVVQCVGKSEDPAAVRARAAVTDVLRGSSWSISVHSVPGRLSEIDLAVKASDGSHLCVLCAVLDPVAVAISLRAIADDDTAILVFDSDGHAVTRAGVSVALNLSTISSLAPAIAARHGEVAPGQVFRIPKGGGEWMTSASPVRIAGWSVVALRNVRAAMASERQVERSVWELFFFVITIGLWLVWRETGVLAQSIRLLLRASRAVAGGDIGYRVHFMTGVEMDTLAEAFNEMADRLEEHQDLLHARNQQLNVLLRVVEGLRPERDPEELLRRITQDAAFLTDAGLSFLAQVENEQLRLHEWWDGSGWVNLVELQWKPGEGVPGWVWQNHDTRSASNYLDDPYASDEMESALSLGSYVCAPIVLPNGFVAGVLFVGNKSEKAAFTEDDIRIMELLARHVGVALEVEAAFLRERRIGATLQKAMLPDVKPQIGGLSIAREYQGASDETELGGDFYDVIVIDADRVGLVIADVSGKGLRAAVQTASVKFALRAYALEDPEPSRVMRRLNRCCCSEPSNRGFVSLFYGVVDLNRWELTFANAGHLPPLLRRAGGVVETLECDGIVLGVDDDASVSFQSQTVALRPGDTLVMYTDGLSEARHGDDFLDTEGLRDLLRSIDLSAHETARMLLDAASAFTDFGLRDDVALLVVKVPAALSTTSESSKVVD